MKKPFKVNSFDFIIFGGIGNLSQRKLFPALYHRYLDGEIEDTSRIIALSRNPMSDDEFRKICANSLAKYAERPDAGLPELERFLACVFHIQADAGTNEGFLSLKEKIKDGLETRIFYLALGPDLFGEIAKKLMKHELITPHARIVVEKPVGHDLASAQMVNDVIGSCFTEHQIFRIDHYLGKETVQNLMALRFANALYDPQWNSMHIDHVQITVSETIGLEDRVSYYDKAGALRDMVQNHLLQLLCLVAMEPPSSMDANNVRDEKLKVLRSLKPMRPEDVRQNTVRGQYLSGIFKDVPMKGYTQELGTESRTETFVALRAEISNWRWGGVPFYLRTGKRLAKQVSEIVIQFRKIPHSIFSEHAEEIPANELVIRLQPNEGIQQCIMIKDPGVGEMRLRPISLDMIFAHSFPQRTPDSYERLLMDVVRGNQTLFMRRDEVEAAWAWIDPILNAWETGKQEVCDYASGSCGPEQANALLESEGRRWRENN